MSLSTVTPTMTAAELHKVAVDVVTTLLPDGYTPVRNAEAEVQAIVAKPDMDETETLRVTNNVTNTVFMNARQGLTLNEIADRVVLELLWCGYWQPEL